MKLLFSHVIAGLLVCSAAATATADSVSLMKHGRAELITNLIDPNMDTEKRLEKLSILKRSQMNLEQVVVRDDKLSPRRTANTRLFREFDRNFLVHASHEANRTLGEHWFQIIGLSSDSLRAARIGRR